MTGWESTPAALVRNGSLTIEAPFEARAREFAAAEHQRAVAEFQAAVDADPSWKWARSVQRDLAERGWPGAVVQVASSMPPELRALHLVATAREARQGVFSPAGADPVAREISAQANARMAAAAAELDRRRLPPELGLPPE